MHRRQDLDALRGLAVLAVMAFHMAPPPGWLFQRLFQHGWMGVDLFFVLSGFLVSGLLFDEQQAHGKIDFRRFFFRRGLKIYPAFYAFLLLSIIGDVAFGSPVRPLAVFCEMVFAQNYGPGVWVHTWSLAVEEHFYLFLPLLLIALTRASRLPPIGTRVALAVLACACALGAAALLPRQLSPLCGALTVLALCSLAFATAEPHDPARPFARFPAFVLAAATLILVLRTTTTIALLHPPFDSKIDLFPSHLRLDALLFGALLAYFQRFSSVVHRPWLALFAICALPALLLDHTSSVFAHGPGITLLYLACGGLIAALGARPLTRLLQPLSFIGFYSYSIYLWHLPVHVWLPRIVQTPIGTELVVSIAIGVAMARIIELPFLRLRDRYFPSRAQHRRLPETAVLGIRAQPQRWV